MTEAFTDTLYSRAKTSSSVHHKAVFIPLFLSETADKFARDYVIKKRFRHALHLVTAHLHRQNQVAHALRSRDFWLASLSPNTFRTARARVSRNLNPLTTEFFPPRQHIFMHSAHTTFVGTPLPQHSLLSGQTWWGPHTWRDPSGNTVNDIHDPPQGQQSEVKGGCQPDFRPAFP